MNKIQNPEVIIQQQENSDTREIYIGENHQDCRALILAVSTGAPDITGDDVDTWAVVGQYMAEEIENLRQKLCQQKTPQYPGILPCAVELKPGLILGKGCKTNTLLEALQRRSDYFAEIDAMTPEERAKHVANIEAFKAMLPNAPSAAASAPKPLTITLPDTSSKAFWSGTRKSEVFHPDTYRRWVKEAIERDCTIAGIEVKVK